MPDPEHMGIEANRQVDHRDFIIGFYRHPVLAGQWNVCVDQIFIARLLGRLVGYAEARDDPGALGHAGDEPLVTLLEKTKWI